MLIVLPMHPFIMFPALFLISNASMHLRSSSLFMLECRILQVMAGWHVICITPVGFNVFVNGLLIFIVKCSLMRVPIVLPVSPILTLLQCRHSISYTMFLLWQRFGFFPDLQVSQFLGQLVHGFFPWGKPL